MPEEYTTLYRAFRPHRFCDVVGQEPIVQTLKNQVKSGRIAHAYLFNGTRGTGKTTTARILARAINCENPQDGEPCGECPTCRALAQENNLDILEIDAASNGSVDQVRDLCAKVAYPPQTCRYRVVIIDEVHSLSTSAASFNALLKTLEEPPEHAVFILATTDPQKLPPTILSRCQRYDFKRIGTKDIAAQLSRICRETQCEAEDEALLDIARAAEGGMRDAISLLDLCMSYSQKHITAQVVQDALGTAGGAARFAFADALAAGDVGRSLTVIDDLMRAGREPAVFAREMTRHLRNVLVACAGCANLLDVSDEDAARYRTEADAFGAERALRAMDLFARAEPEMRWASQPRMQLEMAAVRACRPAFDQSVQALTERLDALERKLASGAYAAPAKPSPARAASAPAASPSAPARPSRPVPEGDAAVWKEVLKEVKSTRMQLFTALKMGSFHGLEGSEAVVSFEDRNEIFHGICLKEDHHALIDQAFTKVCGRPITTRFVLNSQSAPPSAGPVDEGSLFSAFGRENVDIVD
ncbi:MAG: DNA polymerase III subunit gamma/tau [Candidatus Spyradocola sp.]|jgi:DNA polymerase-3 subunit gamma/tau